MSVKKNVRGKINKSFKTYNNSMIGFVIYHAQCA